MIGNSEGFSLLNKVETLQTTLEALQTRYESFEKESRAHHQVSMELRQRTVSTWVRDFYERKTEACLKQIRLLNQNSVHAGNIVVDTRMLRQKFAPHSLEYTGLKDLYGLTMQEYEMIGMVSKSN